MRPAVATVEATATQMAAPSWLLAQCNLAELDEQISKAQTAKEALTQALGCLHDDISTFPNFAIAVAGRPEGRPLEEAHPR